MIRVIDDKGNEYNVLRWGNVEVGNVVLCWDEIDGETPCVGTVELIKEPTKAFILEARSNNG